MRILLAAHQRSGGIGTLARELAARLPGRLPPGDELVVLDAAAAPRWAETRAGRIAYEQAALAFRARRFDLVHLPDYRPLLAARTPFVLTVHDVFFLDHPEWYPPAVGAYKRSLFRAALAKGPAAIACVSAYTRDRLVERFPAVTGRAVVIPPGAPSVPDLPTAPLHGDPYFLTVSTIEQRKNHLGLLRAFRLARRRGLALRWKVAGGPGYGHTAIESELRADPFVDVLGLVGAGELEALYSGATFVATPSYAEGLGFPPLEAFGRGIPVVCSTGSGLDETVGDAALRAPAGDDEAWAEALLELAADARLRAELVRRGKEQVQRFGWDAAAGRYADLYASLRR